MLIGSIVEMPKHDWLDITGPLLRSAGMIVSISLLPAILNSRLFDKLLKGFV